jgi:Mg-chelatase subunit ChlD
MLGEGSQSALGEGSERCQAYDAALEWLYGREGDRGERDILIREGGSGASVLSVPDWLDSIHKLFPKETIERLEQDAVERYGIDDVVTNIDVLERVEPNETLLRAVMKTKHLMNPEVLTAARRLVQRVVRMLMERWQTEVRLAFSGTLDRRRSSPVKIARNLDLKRTLIANLEHYRPDERRIYLEKPYFLARTKRHSDSWQIILLVDQSGSMADSVIHSAITAACLWGLPGMRTHLCTFDTEVVDLTAEITDPVEVLMRVQLGGGTDIGKAVAYGASLIRAPRRSIVVIISDFFEGGSQVDLMSTVRQLCHQGTTVLGLAALDAQAQPFYDRDFASQLVAAGAHVAAMTPGELAGWLAEKVGG